MRRGLTLMETLFALGLLSAVAAALVSWLAVASGPAAGAGRVAQWEIAAQRLLDALHDDVMSFDRRPTARGERKAQRIDVEHGRLSVLTRSGGREVLVRYSLEDGGRLRVDRGAESRIVLVGVAKFESKIDEDGPVLDVTLVTAAGPRSVSRRYPIP